MSEAEPASNPVQGPPRPRQITSLPKEETQLLSHDDRQNESEKLPYPKSIFFIVGNEFCERFSYFGLRAILVLYLTQWLRFNKDLATGVYHSFVVLCYVAPMFGAILADGYLGKYRTIIYLSIVYAAGNTVMTFAAFPPPYWLGPLIGLILIGIGTGGIKPCVSAFGGDQFSSEQEKYRTQFFSVFYFAINLGSFFSMLITPLIREYVRCFGSSCYPVAFGLPAILMLISLVLFWLGRGLYKVYPPTGSVIKNFFFCIGRAVKNRWRRDKTVKNHWLDYADDKYDIAFLGDVRDVLRVFVLFIPLPTFWALFDQQGSRWTLQSIQLDRKIVADWYVLPDQIQAINPILIVFFIPIFEGIVYPLMDKCHLPNRPLQRMVCGMALTSMAFVVAGFLQLRIDATLTELYIPPGHSSIYHINTSPCPVKITSDWMTDTLPLHPGQSSKYVVKSDNYSMNFEMISDETVCRQSHPSRLNVRLDSGNAYFTVSALDQDGSLQSKLFDYPLHKSSLGGTLVGILYIGSKDRMRSSPSAVLYETSFHTPYSLSDIPDFDVTTYRHIPPGKYRLSLTFNFSDEVDVSDIFSGTNGAVYTLVVLEDLVNSNSSIVDKNRFHLSSYINVHPNSVSVWFQVPQYVLITVGETLFAVTGLSFAYSQAPDSMKSVVQAGWLLTTAFGNLFDVIIASLHIPSQTVEFFFFALLMAFMTLIFAVMTYFYKYVERDGSPVTRNGINSDGQALIENTESTE